MRPYRALFLTCFWWFRGWAQNDVNAAGGACLLLVACHFLNVVSIARLCRGSAAVVGVYEWGRDNPIAYVGGILAYFWYFMTNVGKWVDPDDVTGRPGKALNVAAATYLVVTVVMLIAAVVA
jgi:hypothetical protein